MSPEADDREHQDVLLQIVVVFGIRFLVLAVIATALIVYDVRRKSQWTRSSQLMPLEVLWAVD